MEKKIACGKGVVEFSIAVFVLAGKRHFEPILTYRLPVYTFVATTARRALRRHTRPILAESKKNMTRKKVGIISAGTVFINVRVGIEHDAKHSGGGGLRPECTLRNLRIALWIAPYHNSQINEYSFRTRLAQ